MQKTNPLDTHRVVFFMCKPSRIIVSLKVIFKYNKNMFTTCLGIIIRIVSNSYLNVFQKMLTSKGEKSSVVNFFTYLGLSLIGICFINQIRFSPDITTNVLIMGLLGALGNYFIIKALSIGELSTLAPINSYKPIVALIIGMFYLKEIPTLKALLGIILIIFGTGFIINKKNKANKKAILYRILALIFSGAEAIFIKKVILLSDITSAFFLWAFSGLIFSSIFVLPHRGNLKISSYKYQLFLILSVGIMQYATNYVFSKINVSYALALFQLSTLLSVFLGVNIFHETGFIKKLSGALIMVLGACIIILS